MLPNIEKYQAAVDAHEKPKAHLRADWHDYSSKCIYMITLLKMPGIPAFSVIEGAVVNNKATAKSLPSRLGRLIERALKDLPRKFKEYRTLQYVTMPDHIHIFMEISSPSPYRLNDLVLAFKEDCNRRYNYILQNEYDFLFWGNIFDYGFHDRILIHKNQLNTLYSYIRDNPRRLYLKKAFPEYFSSVLMCIVGEEELCVCGNVNLLGHPDKKVVRYNSKFTEEKRKADKILWRETIRNGGVLVSPFIHQDEDEYLQLALDNGGKVIVINDNGFNDRWKPSGRFSEACAEGRVLFVGPKEYSYSKIKFDKPFCMALNKRAELNASLPPGAYRLRRFPK